MTAAALLVLGTRMLVTAGVVVAASAAVQRTGPFLGAMVATLPVSAGPAYLFLALDHGPAFVARSALTSLVSVGATSIFVACHAAVAGRLPMPLALLTALAGWVASLAALSQVDWTLGGAFAATVAITLACIGLTRPLRRHVGPPLPPATRWETAFRAVTVMAVVLGVTLVGQALGPEAAGYAALMPVVFSSLVVLLQPRIGGRATAGIMSHGLAGMLGYAPALALLHLAAVPLGAGLALVLALAVCLAWNGALILVRRRDA
ncbi:hypothetical protein [uncultured Enterovirga sp.]|uniref:hypothetical protein n=1 Tax=uncultured Enterovirga sp. TaxID=2026352 RepID=UPI0035C977F4